MLDRKWCWPGQLQSTTGDLGCSCSPFLLATVACNPFGGCVSPEQERATLQYTNVEIVSSLTGTGGEKG